MRSDQGVRVASEAISRYNSQSRMAKRSFRVGDKVVYPHHGAATIEGIQDREMEGNTRKYYVLRLSYGDLTLMVPMDGAEQDSSRLRFRHDSLSDPVSGGRAERDDDEPDQLDEHDAVLATVLHPLPFSASSWYGAGK